MKTFNLITMVLTILGALDVGAMGLFNADGFAVLFGQGTFVERAVELLIGLSALYQFYPFVRAFQMGEVQAEVAHHAHH